MGAAVKATNANASSSDQLRAVERAGWPGSGALATQQDPARQAALADVSNQLGLKYASPSASGDFWNAGAKPATSEASDASTDDNPLSFFGFDLRPLLQQSVIIAAIVLCVIGGFILIAASVSSSAASNPAVQTAAKAAIVA